MSVLDLGEMSLTAYTNLDGELVDTGKLEWLEDAVELVETEEGEERVECARYWIEGEHSVWLNEDLVEVQIVY